MKQLSMKQLTMFVLLSYSLSLSASNTLVVKVNTGNPGLHSVGNIRNIIFQSGQMVVNTRADNPVVYPLTDILNVVFKQNVASALYSPAANQVGLALYPNPVQNELYVRLPLPVESAVGIQILGIDGKILLQQSYQGANNLSILSVNVSGLSKGIYLCRLVVGNKFFTGKFVK